MSVMHVTPVLNVSHIGQCFAWFEALGWRRGFSWNSGGMIGYGDGALAANEYGDADFACIRSGEAEIFLCVGGQGSRGTIVPSAPGDDRTDGVWLCWFLQTPAEVDAMYDTAVERGYLVTYPPTNEPWGMREFHLRHPDGHMFRVGAGLGECG